jgi:hypothetical protein
MEEQSPAEVPAQARAQPVIFEPVREALAAVVPLPAGNEERPPNLIQPMLSLQAYPEMVRSPAIETPYPEPESDIQPMVSDQRYPVMGVLLCGRTLQLAYVYEPEREPLEQARDSLTQLLPYGTVDDWYAVTEEPLVMVEELKVQEARGLVQAMETWPGAPTAPFVQPPLQPPLLYPAVPPAPTTTVTPVPGDN